MIATRKHISNFSQNIFKGYSEIGSKIAVVQLYVLTEAERMKIKVVKKSTTAKKIVNKNRKYSEKKYF